MMEQIAFGAGCFWGVEATFDKIEGVCETAVGYMGGEMVDPNYNDVCTGETGHAEVVLVQYDETVVSLETLLTVFWGCHNPTTLNRQGWDVGSQYRSGIYYFSEAQQRLAEQSKAALEVSDQFSKPIVTEITAASAFYRAEEYHQKYIAKKQGRY